MSAPHLAPGEYSPQRYIDRSPELAAAIEELRTGVLDQRYSGLFGPIVNLLVADDRYLHCADFNAYAEAHRVTAQAYRDRHDWIRRSILTTARMGRFSSDRTTRACAEEIRDVHCFS